MVRYSRKGDCKGIEPFKELISNKIIHANSGFIFCLSKQEEIHLKRCFKNLILNCSSASCFTNIKLNL